jgi:hypothetical protein
MKRLMTALGLATEISLFSVSPSSAAPTPVQQTQVNGSSETEARPRIHDFPALPSPATMKH